jgi:hypothetical protein
MKVKVLTTIPDRVRIQARVPCVTRLPNGHVQMEGGSVRFPERCPRCGNSPANTEVKLRFTKMRLKGTGRSIKVPFCRRCGWTLKTVQYLPAILTTVFVIFVVPLLKLSHPTLFPKISEAAEIAILPAVAGAAFEWLPRLFIRSGVEIVAVKKGSAELAFDDPLYAEKFVLLNR